jgi:hypothetical protein
MYKHPISAFFRVLPAVSWLTACGIALWMPLRLFLDPALRTWPYSFMLLGFVAVAIYAARMAYKEYQAALPALRADQPIRLGLPRRRRPQPFTPTRHPLSETLRAEVRRLIESLQSAGMLQPGEVAIDELIDRAEVFDKWSKVDLYMALTMLHDLSRGRAQPFANLAFFLTDIEAEEADAANIIQELVRLCGRSSELSDLRMSSISGGKVVPASGASPLPNAVAEFTLGTEHHAVPFVFYAKTLPGGLAEALAKILTRADDPRRFVWDNFDSFFSVSYLTPAQTALVNSAEREQTSYSSQFEEVVG